MSWQSNAQTIASRGDLSEIDESIEAYKLSKKRSNSGSEMSEIEGALSILYEARRRYE